MNRLKDEKSPYLKQHAKNPVDWYAWSIEATERAKKEGKPLLISIGYSTCHWCHVMAKESFEENETAAIMNEHFVNIKVDREERPDIDSLYMKAIQTLTGHGGWPLTVFATPDGVPFYGGTYFPPVSSHGMPSFKNVLATVITAYNENKEGLELVTGQITDALLAPHDNTKIRLSKAIIENAIASGAEHHDALNGGFGGGMKFPHTHFLKFLLKHRNRTGSGTDKTLGMVTKSLSAMASRGLYDAIGGGFHRYTVDTEWGVPHFEKMLYDNTQLIGLYALAYETTGIELYAYAVNNSAEYLVRDMLSPEGGFYSAEDADSDGAEGTYYVWTPDEVREVLEAEDAQKFTNYYSITEHGNFEGANTLRAINKGPDETVNPEIAALHAPLLKARKERTRPSTDSKIIVAWNALAIEAFATASTVLKRKDLLETAIRCADFLLTSLRDENGRLRRYYLGEMSEAKAGLEDYALLGSALLALDSVTQVKHGNKSRWLSEAERLATELIELFYDEKSGHFFDSATDSGHLFVRVRDLFDNDLPSGNAATASFLLSLSLLLKEDEETSKLANDYMNKALDIVGTSTGIIDYPLYHGSMLSVLDTVIAEGLADG